MVACRIDQTLQTFSRVRVTVARPEHIDLIITITRLTTAAGHLRIPIVIISADLAL